MSQREGNLEAPTRHALDWQSDSFYDQEALDKELERVFDICHGCRRCVNLCDSFPTLFDLIDKSDTFEVDGVDKVNYSKVSDQCYLCDICYMTKCPYTPPHEWAVDFPHLMLRAKAVKFEGQGAKLRDNVLSSTDTVGKLASIPLVDVTVNALNNNTLFRKALAAGLGVHQEAPLPKYHSKTFRKKILSSGGNTPLEVVATNKTTGKIALYLTCYGNYNGPELGEDFFKVFHHNGIQMDLVHKEKCCGMPKLELGDLKAVEKLKNTNIPELSKLVDEGYDLTAPIPSCVLMYKQELPLMFPNDPEVIKVQKAFFDPFEYLHLRHKEGKLNLNFAQPLGDISYQVACHQRVQNIGLKTRDILSLIPETQVTPIERCSGHDGTYAVKAETRGKSVRIAQPVVRKANDQEADHFTSDCPMAATHISHLADSDKNPDHPMTLLRKSYGI